MPASSAERLADRRGMAHRNGVSQQSGTWAFAERCLPRVGNVLNWNLEDLTEMMGFDGYGLSPWMWLAMGLMMVLFLGGLILFGVWAIRAIGGSRSANSDNALEVLRKRLAAGDITPEEYEKTRRILQG